MDNAAANWAVNPAVKPTGQAQTEQAQTIDATVALVRVLAVVVSTVLTVLLLSEVGRLPYVMMMLLIARVVQ